ncbi:MAG: hypothetical protein C0508_00920 [Cyanobacteria bacterium PR.023]|nr:hypothetical protein [Cyanobacteria bacterium PR.3.49]MBA4073568.1 hypothetical protein [Cyanobacteria bacterium PR.023]
MFVHRILSGSKTKFLKVLLRECYRQDGKIKQRTLANLTDWSHADIAVLERALKVRRSCAAGSSEVAIAEHQIYSLVATKLFRTKPQAPYQILSALKRPQGSDQLSGEKPLRTRRASRITTKPSAWFTEKLHQAPNDEGYFDDVLRTPKPVSS